MRLRATSPAPPPAAASASARWRAAAQPTRRGWRSHRLMRETLGSPHLDSRVAGAPAAGAAPRAGRAVAAGEGPDLEFAHAVLVLDCDPIADAPILDLRLRKGVRRHGMKLVRATPRAAAGGVKAHRAAGAAARRQPRAGWTGRVRQAPLEVVVLWHERLGDGPDGERAVRALLDLAATLDLAGIERRRPVRSARARQRARPARSGRARQRRSQG